ncbi:hypothetical protein ACLB1N_15605 [Escherichia coli]
MLLAVDGKAVALLAVTRITRSDSVAALQRLHKAGYRLVMLTGITRPLPMRSPKKLELMK